MAVSKASAKWTGTLKEGVGSMKGGSGHFDAPFTFVSRFEGAAWRSYSKFSLLPGDMNVLSAVRDEAIEKLVELLLRSEEAEHERRERRARGVVAAASTTNLKTHSDSCGFLLTHKSDRNPKAPLRTGK